MKAITKTATILQLMIEMDTRYQFLCLYQDNSQWGSGVTRKNIDSLFACSKLFQGVARVMVQDESLKTFHQVDLYDLFADFKAYFVKQFEASDNHLFYMDEEDFWKLAFYLVFIENMFRALELDDHPVTRYFHSGSKNVLNYLEHEFEGISTLDANTLFQRGYL